ncbi:MAG TPA: hypothetical protein VF803_01430 [Candidatus Paceibacterota bacterium]
MPSLMSPVLISATVFLAASLGVFGVVSYKTYAASNGAASEAQVLGDKLQEQDSLQGVMRVLDTTKKERAALAALPVAQGGGADFIATVESLGRTAGVSAKVQNVGMIPPTKTAPGAMSMSVTFSGTFAADERFVRLIETLPQGVVVTQFVMNADMTPPGGVWSGSFNLTAVSFDTP